MKPIGSNNHLITPFVASKNQLYTYSYLNTEPTGAITIDLAVMPPTSGTWQFTTTEATNSDGTFQRALHPSVQNLFYGSGSWWLSEHLVDKKFYPSGSEFYVINVAQKYVGERIRPTTFELRAGASTASLYDDGNGRIVSTTVTNSIVGNIFYPLGIAVIQKATGSFTSSLVSHAGLYLYTGSSVTVEFDSLHTIYEHQVYCTIDPNEFNYSSNPTVASVVYSGSFTGSAFQMSSSGTPALNLIQSGTLTPYVTSIGLYNDKLELVALGKVPRPIRRTKETQQTFVIKFDM